MSDVVARLRHKIFHSSPEHHMIECRPGEIYLRCRVCGLRSEGLKLSPVKLSSRLEGRPAHHRLFRFQVKLVPPAVPSKEVAKAG